MDDFGLLRRNFRFHFVEGSLYLASFAFLNFQIVYPALVQKLGGNDVAVGALQVLTYICYFVPQVFAANYATQTPYRRPWVIGIGIVQRLHIFLLALSIALFGRSHPSLALALFLILFSLNQVAAGLSSPSWFDFLAKTTLPAQRGRLMGMRASFGGVMGFLNSLVLTSVLASFVFPWDYSAVFAIAFAYQVASWFVLRRVSGEPPSSIAPGVPLGLLWERVRAIVRGDRRFRLFLVASAFSTMGLMSASFFAVAALKRFALPESYVGFFTMTLLASQVVLSIFLGLAADRKGHRMSLLVCAGSMVVASILAIAAEHPVWFFVIFSFVGLIYGMELITRYNFASECATDASRPMYIGIMNAWLAPFYLTSLIGGWISEAFGYDAVFVLGSIFALAGFLLLLRVPDARRMPVSSSHAA